MDAIARTNRTRLIAMTLLLAAATLIAGCGSDGPASDGTVASSDQPAGEPTSGGTGTYSFEFQGATGTIDVPSDTNDPRFADIEEFRAAVGGEPVTYYFVEIDNTEGEHDVEMSEITIITDTGEQVVADPVWQVIGDWQDLLDAEIEKEWRLSNDVGTPLYNKYLHDGDLLPGARGSVIFASWGEMSGEPARVYATPYFGEQVEAAKSDS